MLCAVIRRLTKVTCSLEIANDKGIVTIRVNTPKFGITEYVDVVKAAGIEADYVGEYIVKRTSDGSIEIMYASKEFLSDNLNKTFFKHGCVREDDNLMIHGALI